MDLAIAVHRLLKAWHNGEELSREIQLLEKVMKRIEIG
jgi:hypothetical protein